MDAFLKDWQPAGRRRRWRPRGRAREFLAPIVVLGSYPYIENQESWKMGSLVLREGAAISDARIKSLEIT